MRCRKCGHELSPAATVCPNCKQPVRGAALAPVNPQDESEFGGWRGLLADMVPGGVAPLAVAAFYLGLLSFLCFPAPFALALGILALRDLKKQPERGGKARAIFGIVMGVIGSAFLLLGLAGIVLGPAH